MALDLGRARTGKVQILSVPSCQSVLPLKVYSPVSKPCSCLISSACSVLKGWTHTKVLVAQKDRNHLAPNEKHTQQPSVSEQWANFEKHSCGAQNFAIHHHTISIDFHWTSHGQSTSKKPSWEAKSRAVSHASNAADVSACWQVGAMHQIDSFKLNETASQYTSKRDLERCVVTFHWQLHALLQRSMEAFRLINSLAKRSERVMQGRKKCYFLMFPIDYRKEPQSFCETKLSSHHQRRVTCLGLRWAGWFWLHLGP